MGRENSRPGVDYEGDGLRKIRLGQGYGAGEGLFVVAKIRSEAMDAHSCLEEQHVRVDVQEGRPSPIPNNVSRAMSESGFEPTPHPQPLCQQALPCAHTRRSQARGPASVALLPPSLS